MRSFLGTVSRYVYRALFLYGATPLRFGSTVLAIAHVALVALMTKEGNLLGLLVATAALVAIYATCGMPKLPLYAAILASIPGAWMGVTTLVLELASPHPDLVRCVSVFARYTLLSLNALYAIHATNITELASALKRVSRSASLVPLAIARMGMLVREVADMCDVHKLKGVKTSRTLAMALVRGEEVAELMEEGLWVKSLRFEPRAIYSKKGLILQLALLFVDALTFVIT